MWARSAFFCGAIVERVRVVEYEAAPALFSFITHRRERSGGYLFNPYLSRELPLDDFEISVVELCDGTLSTQALTEALTGQFHTDRATAQRRLLEALDKLNGYYALRWRDPLQGAQALSQNSVLRQAGPRTALRQEPALPSGCLSAPLSIIWEITHACNLGCLHCLSSCGTEAPGELSTEEARSLIDQLAQLHVFSITMGGGEPLVRKDVFGLIAYATDKNLAVRLSTNGYAVTHETLQRLAGLNVFSAQVSVDGLRDTHDRLRNHSGAFDRAINALELFAEAGYLTFMTVTASALNMHHIPELVDLAVSLGVSTFKVAPYVPLGRAIANASTLRISHADIKQLALAMREKERRLGDQICFQTDGLSPWLFDPEPAQASPSSECGPGCSAGVSQVVVSYDGQVYPCPYIRDRSAGNVNRTHLGDIWRNETYFAPLRNMTRSKVGGKCRDCAYYPLHCSGGCRGAALAVYGDLYAEDPNCWRGQ